jgi:hypothetical protein
LTNYFFLKDTFYISGIIFYAFPLPIIIVLGVISSWLFFKKRVLVVIGYVFWVLISLFWFSNSFQSNNSSDNNKEGGSVLLWNIAKKDNHPIDIISKNVKANNSNIIALVESMSINDSIFHSYKEKLPNYQFKSLKGKMLIGVKGTIDSIYFEYNKQNYQFNHLVLTIEQKKVSIMIVDVYASPFHFKKDALTSIKDYAIENDIDLIIGDFNTPFESIYFRSFEDSYKSFHKSSDGFTTTWPHGIPLYELDQIWINNDAQLIFLEKKYYKNSDHAMLIGYYKDF